MDNRHTKPEPKPLTTFLDNVPNIHYDNKKVTFIKNFIKYELVYRCIDELNITAKSLKHYKQWSCTIRDNFIASGTNCYHQFTPSLIFTIFTDYINNKKKDVCISFPANIDDTLSEIKIVIKIMNEYSELSIEYPILLTNDTLTKEAEYLIAIELKDIQIANLATKIKKLSDRISKLERLLKP